jgi:hypothetical protein
MGLLYPKDLDEKSGPDIGLELFGEDFEDASWSLQRVDEKYLTWTDKRWGISWKVTAGYLIALQEVSSVADAAAFCEKNKITLFQEGALHYRGTAEVPIVCSRPPPQPDIGGFSNSILNIRTRRGIEASLGYASFLFERLVGRPLQEKDPDLPDPKTVTTLVIRGVDRADVHHVAELALYLLREHGAGARFSFCRFADLAEQLLDTDSSTPLVLPVDPLPDTQLPEALAFFNRALESDPIAGFLYYYRVVEACFEDVLRAMVHAWRIDGALSDIELLARLRGLKDQEDKTGLRAVLGSIVDQSLLDTAALQALIPSASVDVLVTEVYQRRNSIAHGRRGQHKEVLVPYAFSAGRDAHDRAWYDLMATLARRALERYILV